MKKTTKNSKWMYSLFVYHEARGSVIIRHYWDKNNYETKLFAIEVYLKYIKHNE